jgi:membrane-bound ClpP family serine protease
MDTYTLMVFLLVIVGLGIIVSEIFIPSAGMLSILAFGCFCGSAFCAYRAWYEPGYMAAFWTYVACMIIGIPAFIAGGLHVLPKTTLGDKLLVGPQDLATLTPFQEEEQRLTELIEQHGQATTLFSPGGMVQIGREKFHAESEGVIVEPGTDIVVVGVKGNRLVVRPLSLHQTVAGTRHDESSTEGSSTGVDAPVEDVPTAAPDPLAETLASNPDSDAGEAPIDFDMPGTA